MNTHEESGLVFLEVTDNEPRKRSRADLACCIGPRVIVHLSRNRWDSLVSSGDTYEPSGPSGAARVRSVITPLTLFLGLGVVVLSVLTFSGLPTGLSAWLAVPFVFQAIAWTVVFCLIARREPAGIPRISDPGVLVLLWAVAYLIMPSFLWLRGWHLPLAGDLSADIAVRLLWLHTLYILVFGAVFLFFRGRQFAPRLLPGTVERRLPSGWLLFLVPAGFVALAAIARYATGGSPLPTQTYGSAWFDLQASLQSARGGGGIGYLLVQVESRLSLYMPLIQGIGAGLLLANARRNRRGLWWKSVVVGMTLITMLLFSTQPRSSILVVALIGIIFADMVGPPIHWRHMAVVIAMGLFVFVFLQYFRAAGSEDFGHRIAIAYQGFQEGAGPGPLSEFTSMFGKEAGGFALFTPAPPQGATYLLAELATPMPGQLLPAWLQEPSTAQLLSQHFLGDRFSAAGAGVAGSSIVDGLRTWGVTGVALLAAIFGAGFGALRRWSLGFPKPREYPLLRAALYSGIVSWTVIVIRSDVANFVLLLFYYVAIPYVLAKMFFPGRAAIRSLPEPAWSWRTGTALAARLPVKGDSRER